MKEKKMRLDDALNATKAAVEEGVVPGGGVTLFHATKEIDLLKLDGDEQIGLRIVKRSLEEPVRQIAKNSGRDGAEVIAFLKQQKDEKIGYNAKKDSYEDLFASGVIDPTKVVRSGLQHAASIAGMVLTTEALVTDFDEEKDEKTPAIII
jgi:chaperonin GroEL